MRDRLHFQIVDIRHHSTGFPSGRAVGNTQIAAGDGNSPSPSCSGNRGVPAAYQCRNSLPKSISRAKVRYKSPIRRLCSQCTPRVCLILAGGLVPFVEHPIRSVCTKDVDIGVVRHNPCCASAAQSQHAAAAEGTDQSAAGGIAFFDDHLTATGAGHEEIGAVEENVVESAKGMDLTKDTTDSERLQKWLESLNPEDLGKYKM